MHRPFEMENNVNTKPRALVICFSELHRDPRVLREIEWLRGGYDLTTIGLTPSGFEGIRHIPYEFGAPSSLFGKVNRAVKFFSNDYETYYWGKDKTPLVEKLKDDNFDLIVANDIDTVPLTLRIAKPTTKVLFDAHEYAPLELTESLRWRILRQPLVEYIAREYVPRVSIATTVCQGIAEKFESEYGKKFSIITNAAEFEDLQPSPTSSERIRLIYHGNAHPTRQTQKQIEMMRFLDDRFELNLMVVGDTNYIASLKQLAASHSNVNFLPPIGTKEIASFTNQFDIGIYSLPPTNFNNEHALPNKFFEYIQARLAIVIAPSPEMVRLVKQYELGVVAEDFSPRDMAHAILGLTVEQINQFKANASKHAYELSAEKNRELFMELIR